jgi:hypothetical protein
MKKKGKKLKERGERERRVRKGRARERRNGKEGRKEGRKRTVFRRHSRSFLPLLRRRRKRGRRRATLVLRLLLPLVHVPVLSCHLPVHCLPVLLPPHGVHPVQICEGANEVKDNERQKGGEKGRREEGRKGRKRNEDQDGKEWGGRDGG